MKPIKNIHTDHPRTDKAMPCLYQKSKHGFTLVELIVTITIIAILWVIAFTAFNGYQSGARDSARTSDLTLIEQWLGISYTKQGTYPTPDNIFSVTYSGAQVWNQWTISTGVVQKLDSIGTKLSRKPTDPLYPTTEYTYSLLNTAKEYQLATVYEWTPPWLSYNNPFPLIPQAFAADKPVAYIKGNYNGIMAKVSTGSIIYVLAVPSIILADSGTTNLALISSGSWVLSGKQNLPKSYQTAGLSLTGNLTFQPTQPPTGSWLVIYASGSLPTTNSGIIDLIHATQSSYTGTTIQNIPQIQNLLQPQSTTTLVDLWNGTLRTSLQATALTVTTIDNQPQTFTCSGTATTPASWLTQSKTPPTDNITPYTYSATTTTTWPACTWKCDTGYTQNGNTCEVKLYVDDVFSTYLYDWNGWTQTITNWIDLTKGGLVWSKGRNGATSHELVDTSRGIGKGLKSNTTDQEFSVTDVSGFNSTGYNLGYQSALANQPSGNRYVSWTFRKAPKFFDVVTWTGDSVAGRQIPHSLGVVPGMIIVKRTDTATNWTVYHRGLIAGANLQLNTTSTQIIWNYYFGNGSIAVDPTTSIFTIGTSINTTGGTYVAYIFAHDTSTDGIIKCGTYNGTGGAGNQINLGWEPQWLIAKESNVSGNHWTIWDSTRWMSLTSQNVLFAESSVAETLTSGWVYPTATGFQIDGGWALLNGASSTYIYCAIRRPNKPVMDPTKVYNAITRTGDGGAISSIVGSGFPPDLFITKVRDAVNTANIFDRLRGPLKRLIPTGTAAEDSLVGTVTSFDINGVDIGNSGQSTYDINYSPKLYINHFFRRAPGFFDIVAYTGVAGGTTINHSLGITPDFVITKAINNATGDWYVWSAVLGNKESYLNSVVQAAIVTQPTATSSTWTLRTGLSNPANNYISYLFATLHNISKVGNYIGNGTSQPINADFDSTARFILIKRTDVAGDWYVWDSARGIVAGNDPHLSLNTTAAEVTTDDSVDPDAGGFVVNQVAATNINVSGATYIYLAVH